MPRASRIASASASDAASATAAAQPRRRRRSRAAGRTRRRRRRARSSITLRRPWRIGASPRSPRAQRSAIALASVGTSRATASTRSSCVGVERCPRAVVPTSSRRARTSSGVSSPSQPAPKTAPTAAACAGTARGASSTASASGLARPGSSPWASTSPPTSSSTIRSQPSCAAASSSAAAIARGPGLGSTSTVRSPVARATCDSQNRKPPGPLVSGPGERDGVVQPLGVLDLVEPARAGDRVDRTALPGRGRRPRRRRAAAADRERADDVPAAADAHDQRARAVGGARNGQALDERRDAALDDRADLLRGPVELVVARAPACPRRAGRGRARGS